MEEKRHYSVIDPYTRKLTFTYKNEVIAETTNALILKEVGKSVYNPVFYLPKEDIKASLQLEPQRASHCPIKGDATYWTIEGETLDTYFAWSYEEPLPRSKKIKGHVAFNMDFITMTSAPV